MSVPGLAKNANHSTFIHRKNAHHTLFMQLQRYRQLHERSMISDFRIWKMYDLHFSINKKIYYFFKFIFLKYLGCVCNRAQVTKILAQGPSIFSGGGFSKSSKIFLYLLTSKVVYFGARSPPKISLFCLAPKAPIQKFESQSAENGYLKISFGSVGGRIPERRGVRTSHPTKSAGALAYSLLRSSKVWPSCFYNALETTWIVLEFSYSYDMMKVSNL